MSHVVAFLGNERAATALEYGLIATSIALGTLAILFRRWCENQGRVLVAAKRGVDVHAVKL